MKREVGKRSKGGKEKVDGEAAKANRED